MSTATLVQNGSTIRVTAPTGGYTAGTMVSLVNMVGVVSETVAASATAVLVTEGVYTVTAKKAGAGEAWAIGDDVYLTATGDLTETATSNVFAGTVWETAATGATTGKIRINFGGKP